MKKPVFIGAATAIVTPFSSNDIDFASYDRILSLQLAAGIHGIVVCGTTGEASTMTLEEKQKLFEHTVEFVDHRCVVIAGVGTNNTASSVQMAKTAQQCGVDGLLAVTPYYNKCTQEGLIRHYYTIADSTPLPLITYNVPGRTGVNIKPETCLALSRHPNINGIKEASGSISQIARIAHCCGESFHIWAGNDDQITATMSLGGCGVISVLSNLRPKVVVEIVNACLKGDYTRSAQLQAVNMPLIDGLFSEVNPIPVKAALHSLGLCQDDLRLPLTRMSETARNLLLQALQTCPEI